MKRTRQEIDQDDGRDRKTYSSSIRWMVTLGLLTVTAWLIYRQDPEFLSQITLDWGFLIPAAWLLGLYIMMVSERFRTLTQLYLNRYDLSSKMFLHSLVVSRVLNGILPQAGNIYRGSHLLVGIGLPWSGYIAVVIAGMIIDILVIAVVFGAILVESHILQINLLHFPLVNQTGILAFTTAATVISVLLHVYMRKKYRTAGSSTRSAVDDQSVAALRRRIVYRRNLPALVLQSLVTVALLSTVLWLILLGMGINPGLLEAATLMVATRAAQYIVITPGNLGVRELVYAAVGSQLTIGIGAAVSASILLRIMNWIVLGLLMLAMEGLKGWWRR